MRLFKTKAFTKWATKEGLADVALEAAVAEIEKGLIDADLGGHVIKKSVSPWKPEAKAVERVRSWLIR